MGTYEQEDGGKYEGEALVPLLLFFAVCVFHTNDESHVVGKEDPEIAGRAIVDYASAEWEEPTEDLGELLNRLVNQERPKAKQRDAHRLYCQLQEISQLLRDLVLVVED